MVHCSYLCCLKLLTCTAVYVYTCDISHNYLCAHLFVDIGRVLNRFSKDIGFMDAVLPNQFVEFITVS